MFSLFFVWSHCVVTARRARACYICPVLVGRLCALCSVCHLVAFAFINVKCVCHAFCFKNDLASGLLSPLPPPLSFRAPRLSAVSSTLKVENDTESVPWNDFRCVHSVFFFFFFFISLLSLLSSSIVSFAKRPKR